MTVLYRTPAGRELTTTEELDREYDIEATVAPEVLREIGALYRAGSERARTELDCELGVKYGPTRAEQLDVYRGRPGGPVVVFYHGGYWHKNNGRTFGFLALGLVAHGATVVVPSYALCPSVSLTEIVRQNRASLAWTYHNAKDLGADPSRIAVAGHSAGGHAVGMLMSTDWWNQYDIPEDVIVGGCAISGVFDVTPLRHSFLQPSLRLTAEEAVANSPALNLPQSAGRLLVTYGDQQTDEFERQSDDYLAAWQHAGLQGELLVQRGRNHFDELLPLMEAGSELTESLMRLVD